MSTTSQPTTPSWNVRGVQEAFCKSTARYRTLVAGRRFGKNHAAITSQADFAIDPAAYPYGRDDPNDVVIWWVGPTYNQTRKYGYQTAKEALPDELITETRNTQPFEIHLSNGVIWEFYSFDRPQSLDGAGVDDITIDERGYMPTEIWEENLAAMLLDTNGRAAFIGKAWPNEHFRECFEKGQSPEHPTYESWHATSYDNPAIPDARIDELFGDLPEQVYRREIMAEFDAGGSHLTREMLSFVHVDELAERDLSWHVAVDLGLEADPDAARSNDTDYWAAAIIGHDSVRQQAYLVDTARTRGMTKDQGVEWLASIMESVPTAQATVESTQAQRWFVEDAQKRGLRVQGVKHDRAKEDRLMYLSVPFAKERVQVVNHDDADSREPGQEFDPRWDAFVREWLAFPNGRHDDLLDAVEMALRQVNLGGSITAYTGSAYGET